MTHKLIMYFFKRKLSYNLDIQIQILLKKKRKTEGTSCVFARERKSYFFDKIIFFMSLEDICFHYLTNKV